VLEILSRLLWCCGDLGEGWAEETLSLRLQLLESLVEECEVVEEARPPRRVAKISGFLLCRDEVFCCCSLDPGFFGSGGSTTMCEAWGGQSHGGGARDGCSGLQRAAASSRHIVGDNSACVEGWFRFPLPSGRG
jgi:hypothetical protein